MRQDTPQASYFNFIAEFRKALDNNNIIFFDSDLQKYDYPEEIVKDRKEIHYMYISDSVSDFIAKYMDDVRTFYGEWPIWPSRPGFYILVPNYSHLDTFMDFNVYIGIINSLFKDTTSKLVSELKSLQKTVDELHPQNTDFYDHI